jgi:8-oxo-dGTP pyrophosphatase MutT (NUDIX family)
MKDQQNEGLHLAAPRPGLQYAALPYRDDHGLSILLITSRDTNRWVIPKGWPMKGRKPHATAAQEALEEAGLIGKIAKQPIGEYHYLKRLKHGAPLECTVEVFPMKVEAQRFYWREQGQRTARWFAPDDAADAVQEPELQALILEFAQAAAGGGALRSLAS